MLRNLQSPTAVWRESRVLIWRFRWRLAAGLGLILVDRAAGLVLPGSSKILIDEILATARQQLEQMRQLNAGQMPGGQAVPGQPGAQMPQQPERPGTYL